MPVTHYPAIIDRSASGYGVTFPDFPGCIANGATVTEAAVQAEAALGFHIEAMAKDGDPIPEPSDYAEACEQLGAGEVGLLIRVDQPAKIARVLVSIDESLLRRIDAVASNRSAWLSDAARSALRSSVHATQAEAVDAARNYSATRGGVTITAGGKPIPRRRSSKEAI